LLGKKSKGVATCFFKCIKGIVQMLESLYQGGCINIFITKILNLMINNKGLQPGGVIGLTLLLCVLN
jgi:hypothetical protein